MKKIIVTACDNKYFNACLTLIASIHKYGYEYVNEIQVFNLGLGEKELTCLSRLEKVEIKNFPDDIKNTFESYLIPNQHAYKPYCLFINNYSDQNILWMDSGICFVNNFKIIFDIIEKDNIFLVQDYHENIDWTSKECIEIMEATTEELYGLQLSSGILGYRTNGPYQFFINEAYEYSKIKECIHGDHKNHRHDQSIFSILAARYKIAGHSISIYGEWRGKEIWKNQIVYVHRRKYHNVDGLRRKVS